MAAAPDPLTTAPELPEGVEPSARSRWPPWASVMALITAFAGALMGALVIRVVASAVGASLEEPPPAVSIAGTVVQDVCLVASALLFANMVSTPRPGDFGLRGTRVWSAIGWMLVTWVGFFIFTAAWVTLLGADPQDERVLLEELGVDASTLGLIAVAFLVAVLAPVAEEFFFRGFFYGALRNWKGVWPAAVLTGAVFGGIHAGSSDPAFLVPLAVFGLGLCLLYERTGSLYPCVALHCVNNSIAFGATQDWTWQTPLLLVLALAAIALGALAVRRVWSSGRPAAAPAAA